MNDAEIVKAFFRNWKCQDSMSDGNRLYVVIDDKVKEEFYKRLEALEPPPEWDNPYYGG